MAKAIKPSPAKLPSIEGTFVEGGSVEAIVKACEALRVARVRNKLGWNWLLDVIEKVPPARPHAYDALEAWRNGTGV